MAKRRMIDTRFWSDNFISELNPLDRYLFLYFLTNEHTNICGIYEVPLKTISYETGIEVDMLKKMLKRISTKITYLDGWVAIKNFAKYQSDNESVRIGVDKAKDLIPKHILEGVDRVWQCVPTLPPVSDISESESESESELKPKDLAGKKPAECSKKFNPLGGEIIKAFIEIDPKNKSYYSNKTQRSACDFLLEEYGLEEVLNRLKILPQLNKMPYFPSIHTPWDLKEKWKKLEEAVEREQFKLKTNKREVII